MRVLLTGGAGFLGRHVLHRLSQDGHDVVALLRSDPSEPLPGCTMVRFNGEDPAPALEGVGRFDAVINMATSYGRDGRLSPVAMTNLLMPLRLMELAHQRGWPRWIEAGTYFTGAPGWGPLPAYVLGKRQFQDWARLSATTGGPAVTVAVLHHLYGPGDRPDKFIPRFLAQCLAGETIPMTPGDQVRDFMHAEDAAAALVLLASGPGEPGFRAIDVGTGTPTTILEFAQLAVRLTGSRARLRPGALPYRIDEIMHAVADSTYLRQIGWRPRYNLVQGITSLVTP